MGTAVLLTLAGMGRSAVTRRTMVVWPALGWAFFLVTFVTAGFLLNAGVSG
jgi:hypothetical protein